MPQEWAVVGRDRDLAEITALIEDPTVRGVALVGAAGVGKSRLAREIARYAASNEWTVRSVAATVTSRSVSLGAFARWTDDRGGAPASLVRRVGDAIVQDATVKALLVVIDDAHLLDDLSALVVDHLVDSGATLLLTVRAGEPAPVAITAQWKERRLLRREIDALSPADVTAVLERAYGAFPDRQCAQRFWDMTRGNMLYIRQLADQEEQAGRLNVADGALRWQGDIAVRGSLAELVEAHIGDLREPVRDVVDLVAVSEPVEWRVVASLASQTAIEEAEQRGLIRITDGQLFVGHPLFAEVRRAQCGSAKLRRLRGLVASSMDDAVGAAQLIKRGLLWLESDLPPDGRILQAAASAANSLLDFDIADRLLAAAAQAGTGADAHVSRAWTLFMMSEGESVERVLAEAPSTAGDTGYVNDVVMRAMNAFWTLRSPDESNRIVDDALAGEVGSRRQQILVFRAMQYALAARTMDVLDTLDDIDTTLLDPHGMAMTCLAECKASGDLGRLDQVVSSATAAVQSISRSEIATPLLGPVTEVFTDGLATSGRIRDAMDVAGQFHRSRHSQPAAIRTVADQILGMAHLAAGDLIAALRLLPARFEPSDWAGRGFLSVNSFARFHLLRAQVLARLGDASAAATAIATARTLHHPGYAYYDSWYGVSEAWLAAARGHVDDARDSARAAADVARGHDQPAREVWALQNAVHFGDRTVVDRLSELAAQMATPRSITAARYAIALVGDDADGLLAASERFESIGDRLAATEAAAQCTVVHRSAASVSEATTAAARTRRLSVDCGGATSPAIALATGRFEPPFTNTERDIVMLVARGATNREIAQAMSLSVRTVESHIYRASRKAGVKGRAGLRIAVIDRSDPPRH
ncbi:LuxR C-terminal-related transcriptional regulator [Williamsia sp. MIQD14]|uniref:helix-turn-helix transcriptional regulator n=1 Tax=Williamsia sp. MIQD14 TaxID=3425703 RepID=UPI003DA056A4